MPKTLDLRERRERLRLSRERLARLADVSSASIELFEGGFRPQRSRVLPAVYAALARAEAERDLIGSETSEARDSHPEPREAAGAGGSHGAE